MKDGTELQSVEETASSGATSSKTRSRRQKRTEQDPTTPDAQHRTFTKERSRRNGAGGEVRGVGSEFT